MILPNNLHLMASSFIERGTVPTVMTLPLRKTVVTARWSQFGHVHLKPPDGLAQRAPDFAVDPGVTTYKVPCRFSCTGVERRLATRWLHVTSPHWHRRFARTRPGTMARVETIYRTSRNNMASVVGPFRLFTYLFTYLLHFSTNDTDILIILRYCIYLFHLFTD